MTNNHGRELQESFIIIYESGEQWIDYSNRIPYLTLSRNKIQRGVDDTLNFIEANPKRSVIVNESAGLDMTCFVLTLHLTSQLYRWDADWLSGCTALDGYDSMKSHDVLKFFKNLTI